MGHNININKIFFDITCKVISSGEVFLKDFVCTSRSKRRRVE